MGHHTAYNASLPPVIVSPSSSSLTKHNAYVLALSRSRRPPLHTRCHIVRPVHVRRSGTWPLRPPRPLTDLPSAAGNLHALHSRVRGFVLEARMHHGRLRQTHASRVPTGTPGLYPARLIAA